MGAKFQHRLARGSGHGRIEGLNIHPKCVSQNRETMDAETRLGPRSNACIGPLAGNNTVSLGVLYRDSADGDRI